MLFRSATAIAGGTEDNTVSFSAADLLAGFSDVESANATLTVAGLSANNGSITDDGQGNYTSSPDDDFNGTVTINYVVSDPDGGRTLASTSFAISAVNDAPIQVVSDPVLTFLEEEGTFVISEEQLLATFVDQEGDTLSVESVSVPPASGTLVANGNGTWSFTAANEFSGEISVEFQVSDGTNSVDGSASMTVVATNYLPVLTGTPLELENGSEDVVYQISESDLLTGYTDSDLGSSLSITGVMATGGIANNNEDGTWSFTPTENYNGQVNLTYVITDGEGGIREVHGDGVVGEQPTIVPGDEFTYTSGAILETAVGTMEGYFEMVAADGEIFKAKIPVFTLLNPGALH